MTALPLEPLPLQAEPRVFRPLPNLVVVWFPLMKIAPARAMVAAAPAESDLIETSSGTMGLALAMVAAAAKRKLTLVTPVLAPLIHAQISALGEAKIIEVDGNQEGRLQRLEEELVRNPNLHWTRQYESKAVVSAYAPFAHTLAHLKIDAVVAAVGSGGSAAGFIGPLRRVRKHAELIAVDCANSILFGRPDGKRRTSGIGNSILPVHLDQSLFDYVHWFGDGALAGATVSIARERGWFLGPTGAGVLKAAEWHAREAPEEQFAAILADEGYRYLDTTYAEEIGVIPRQPDVLSAEAAQSAAIGDTCWIASPWSRRTP